MKISQIDLSSMIKYGIPAALLILILLYAFMRKLVITYINILHDVKHQQKAVHLRQELKGAQAVIVRKTDLFADLTPAQKIVHKRAEDVLAQKKYLEAAKIFESINFQRKAVDILEFNGFIEEAAQVLLSMKVPFRAAVILERNGRYIRAAECFLVDNKKDSAARSYEKAAEKDYHYLGKAALYYFESGMIDNALSAYARILASDEIHKIGFAAQKFDAIGQYMADPYNANYLLAKISPEQIKSLIESLTLLPSIVQSMSVWVMYRRDVEFISTVFARIANQEDLAVLFWNHINATFAPQLPIILAQKPSLLSRSAFAFHGNLLLKLQKKPLSDHFLALAPEGREDEAPFSPMTFKVPGANWKT